MPSPLASIARLPSPDMSDAEVAVAAAAGEPAAQGLAWDRLSPLVRGLLRKSMGPGDADIEDMVQDVFIRFFRNIATLRKPDSVRSFIIGITMRVAASELRRRRVKRWLRLVPSHELPEPAVSLDEESREALRRLYAVLDKLGDQARLAFVLRFVEGLELTEVAAGLDVSLATAKRRLSKVSKQVSALVDADPILRDYAGGLA